MENEIKLIKLEYEYQQQNTFIFIHLFVRSFVHIARQYNTLVIYTLKKFSMWDLHSRINYNVYIYAQLHSQEYEGVCMIDYMNG